MRREFHVWAETRADPLRRRRWAGAHRRFDGKGSSKNTPGTSSTAATSTRGALSDALADGAIDEAVAENDLSMCDLVFFALYPQQTVAFVRENIRQFRPGALLVDLCGVKRFPVENLTDFCAENGLCFIGGHPMAGRECWGFSGSDADLYKGASMILTPGEHAPAPALELLEGLFADLGFGSITTTTPAAHDSMIAFTSQLAHVVSSAYIKAPAPGARGLLGGQLQGSHTGGEAQPPDVDRALSGERRRPRGGDRHDHGAALRNTARRSRETTPKHSSGCSTTAAASRRNWTDENNPCGRRPAV